MAHLDLVDPFLGAELAGSDHLGVLGEPQLVGGGIADRITRLSTAVWYWPLSAAILSGPLSVFGATSIGARLPTNAASACAKSILVCDPWIASAALRSDCTGAELFGRQRRRVRRWKLRQLPLGLRLVVAMPLLQFGEIRQLQSHHTPAKNGVEPERDAAWRAAKLEIPERMLANLGRQRGGDLLAAEEVDRRLVGIERAADWPL